MKYVPRYKTANEILEKLGYIHANRGYQKVLIPEKIPKQDKWSIGIVKKKVGVIVASTRLHALPTYDGLVIDLHLDEPSPVDKSVHKSRKFCKKVEVEIKRFKK